MKKRWIVTGTLGLLLLAGVGTAFYAARPDADECVTLARHGLRRIATDRRARFLGKVHDFTAACRGGERALRYRATPWVDWGNYWGAGDATTRARSGFAFAGLDPDARGVTGALLDLEYQRIELIKFNLFDNYTFEAYVRGRGGVPGRALREWPEMRLAPGDPHYAEVGGARLPKRPGMEPS